ncbi:MutS-related protein [Pedobacter hartonius]|uniref:MutS domain V n=1 Tax=Pedobacter hartonius TaxID=425514 RepID=A0A1H3YNL0_9SPHI|nr:hypothetical protein [Pedobacter hartonius]SEA12604.1 MutS domain V [Pedobacter hartonius]
MVKSKDSILKGYQNNVEIQKSQIAQFRKTLNNISYTRLGLFLTEVIFVAIIINFGYYWPIGILMCLPVLFFMIVLKRGVAIQNELNYAEKLFFVFQNEVDLIMTGQQHYDNGEIFEDERHPYASDLDIYGSSSLYAMINRSNTVMGMKLLADSLGKPGDLNDLPGRQQAITELKDHIDQTFHFRAGLQNHQPEQLQVIEDKLAHELPGQLKFSRNKALKFYTTIAPLFSVGLFILGSIYGGAIWSFLGLCVLVNFSVVFFHGKNVSAVYLGFSGSSGLLTAISGTVKWTEELKWQSSYIQRFFSVHAAGIPLSRQINELSSIIDSFDIRLNILLGPIFNGFLLWDIRCVMRIDKWYASSSARLIEGLHTISRFEELISFATLAYNEPNWNYPLVTGTFHFEATGLGHPLIREGKRVINNYQFEGRPTVDIVTGSNMAGKSTFLRTVGINMVLAFSGAPVCAVSMTSSVFEILTYMRIKDSLNDQTSTFKAELNRLKMILEGVRILEHPLVLIDEMLRGTNSKDKYLGSKVFIQQVIKEQTPTLFATHDLQLSEMVDSYSKELRNYHFDIQLAEGEMNFDYKLKYGACKTFNAALLLKEIGLSFNPEELND